MSSFLICRTPWLATSCSSRYPRRKRNNCHETELFIHHCRCAADLYCRPVALCLPGPQIRGGRRDEIRESDTGREYPGTALAVAVADRKRAPFRSARAEF